MNVKFKSKSKMSKFAAKCERSAAAHFVVVCH